MVTSKRVYIKGDLPRLLLPVPHPCGKPLPTHSSTGDLPTLAGILVQSPVESLLLSSESWCAQVLFVLSKTGVSASPSPVEVFNKILLAFKVRFPGDSQSLCQVPRLGSLTWSSEASQQWDNFFGIIALQFVGWTG